MDLLILRKNARRKLNSLIQHTSDGISEVLEPSNCKKKIGGGGGGIQRQPKPPVFQRLPSFSAASPLNCTTLYSFPSKIVLLCTPFHKKMYYFTTVLGFFAVGHL